MPPRIKPTISKGLARLGDGPLEERVSRKGVNSFLPPCCAQCRRTLSTSIRTRNPSTRNGLFTRKRTTASLTDRHGAYHLTAVSSATLATASSSLLNVPPRLRPLYATLSELGDAVPERINLSRLQLALRGLESEVPVIRVAVLGLDDVAATLRLVRVLLADPLGSREPWEDWLESYGAQGTPGLLIRYGEESGIVENSLLPTLTVPSTLLKKGNIEIIVSSLGAGLEPSGVPVTEDSLLVPTIMIPTSDTGRLNSIRYPVHRTVVCGTGIRGLLRFSELVSRADQSATEGSLYGAIELEAGEEVKDSRVSFVDTKLAEQALAKFRESVQFASEYERGWSRSGVQPLIDYLATTEKKNGGLSPDLHKLIRALLNVVEAQTAAADAARAKEQKARAMSPEEIQDLENTLSTWAERAHTELRNSLDEGFASKRWRGLAWWKLFWRVDDVGMISSELLQTRYLPQAEKEMIWTAGRVTQAGLRGRAPYPNSQEFTTEPASTAESRDSEEGSSADHPWPMRIQASRQDLNDRTVPSLQAIAQELVLFSASTTGLTSALSALLYTSASTGLYEACTAAAVGLIYSLRRQQTKWESARRAWETEVRETGRSALIDTENYLRDLLQRSAEQRVEDGSEARVRELVARGRNALEDLKQG